MSVDMFNHVPAICSKASRRIIGEPSANLAINGDAVVVPKDDKFAQAKRPCKRTGLVGDAFHHATIAQENIGVVIDNHMFATIELRRQDFFGKRHTNAVGDTLSEGACCGFHAWGITVFRMAGRSRMQLTKILQLGDRQVIACKMQQSVMQH